MLEIEKIADDIGISVEAYKKLCRTFLENSRKDLAELKKAIEAEDRPAVRSRAHHVKGAALNIDLTKLSELAKGLEKTAETEPFEELTTHLRALEEEYTKSEKALRKQL
jgi:HPt (histidine-containing phosphotransfer) domain-containing protein